MWKNRERKIRYGHLVLPVAGSGYGLGICLLSRLLLRNLSVFVPLLGMKEKTAAHITQVLGQLRGSVISSPWLVLLAVCGVLGWSLSRIPKHKGRIWITAALAVLLLLPVLLGAVWLSRVNGIMIGKLLLSVLQWL